MLTQTIIQHLHTSRRLVIPGLGAFIVKGEGGAILFSELLKGDDGVLRGLLISQGLRDIEAAALIDRFIFELKHSLGEGDSFMIAGLGYFERGDDGKMHFIHKVDVEDEAFVENSEEPVQMVEADVELAQEESEGSIEEDDPQPQEEEPASEQVVEQELFPQDNTMQSGEALSAESYRAQRIKELYESSSKPSFLSDVDPSIKGLEYGKGKAAKRGVKNVPKPEKRVDFVLIVAIVAAVVALLVVGYGYNANFVAEHGISVIDYLKEMVFGGSEVS